MNFNFIIAKYIFKSQSIIVLLNNDCWNTSIVLINQRCWSRWGTDQLTPSPLHISKNPDFFMYSEYVFDLHWEWIPLNQKNLSRSFLVHSRSVFCQIKSSMFGFLPFTYYDLFSGNIPCLWSTKATPQYWIVVDFP